MDVGGVAVAQGEMVSIRAVESVHLVLALVAVVFALCVVTLHTELKQQGGECAAIHRMHLLLSAGAQGVAATVAAMAADPWRQLIATCFASLANGVSLVAFLHLVCASTGLAVFAFHRCHGHLLAHRAMFIAHVLLFTRGIALCFALMPRG